MKAKDQNLYHLENHLKPEMRLGDPVSLMTPVVIPFKKNEIMRYHDDIGIMSTMIQCVIFPYESHNS